MRRFLGVFVNPVDVQSEGPARVLDNVQGAGATAIATTSVVGRPVTGGGGVRFPDLHIDGHARILDRPLWGRRELRLEFFSAHEPDPRLYDAGRYRPPIASPADVDRDVPSRMIEEASARRIQVHIQVHPFLPPGVREEDRPVRVDGSRPQGPQVVNGACLNSPAAEAYALALVTDTVRHYPRIDGLFLDWAEFDIYCLEDHFACFCSHCERQALDRGLPWELITRDVAAGWNRLHALTPVALAYARRAVRSPSGVLGSLMRRPGWLHFLQFKATRVVEFYRKVRALLDAEGLQTVQLSARGWPPPWNRSSGMDYSALADVCHAVTPKLFTFDYSALPRWYGETLARWNPDLPESLILDTLVEVMNLPDAVQHRSFAQYHIPAPDKLHPAKIECYAARIDEVVDEVDGKARCYPFAHAYLPESQWAEMVALIRDSRADGMWVQMYGYLSDRKLEILKDMWAS